MKASYLKPFRIIVSLFVLVSLLLVFLGITNAFIGPVTEVLLRLQFFPSLISFFALSLGFLTIGFLFVLLLTLLFGRVYCSSICPLGTFQDFFIRLRRFFRKKKNRKFKYSPSSNKILRYSILTVTLLFWISGSLFFINLLDPYSNFGKIATGFFQPAYIWINNQLAFILEGLGVYAIAPLQEKSLPLSVGLLSGGIFITLFGMTLWRGRLFCNTICPVGSILSLVSPRAVYRLGFYGNCNSCGKCERVCKAECIDSKTRTIDNSRCITCFNCLSSCPNQSILYQRHKILSGSKKRPEESVASKDKRAFLLTLATGFLSIPLINKKTSATTNSRPGMIPSGSSLPVIPPGAQGIEHFNKNCVACYLCVSACPKNVIVPSFFEFGIKGFMQPKLDYHRSFCNFNCVACTEACPTAAIMPQTVEQKQTIQLGIARFMVESCIVTIDKTDCGACSEHCPTKAVSMIPHNGLFLPQVRPELCIGCGACEYACPTQPYKAIYVESNLVHLKAVPIEDSKGPKAVEQDDFPF